MTRSGAFADVRVFAVLAAMAAMVASTAASFGGCAEPGDGGGEPVGSGTEDGAVVPDGSGAADGSGPSEDAGASDAPVPGQDEGAEADGGGDAPEGFGGGTCDGLVCDDGDPCNGAETCDPAVGCVAATLLACDDGNACNGVEACLPGLGCVAGEPLLCDDGLPCNGVEGCDPEVGCFVGPPFPGCCKSVVDCEDGNPCNGFGDCDLATEMCTTFPPAPCDDGNLCDGFESCDPSIGCVPGAPTPCSDDNPCNGFESCDASVGCVSTPALDCDDGDPATIEWCDSVLGCQSKPKEAVCPEVTIVSPSDNSTFVWVDPVGTAVKVTIKNPVDCPLGDGGGQCHVQWILDGVVVATTTTTSFTFAGLGFGLHAIAVRLVDVTGAPFPCAESVDEVNLTISTMCANAGQCFDGNPCSSELCLGGVCKFLPVEDCCHTDLDCDDADPCNGVETCDPASVCLEGTPVDCADGDPCNGDEVCDPFLGCGGGEPLDCDDGDPLTLDSCAEGEGCTYEPLECPEVTIVSPVSSATFEGPEALVNVTTTNPTSAACGGEGCLFETYLDGVSVGVGAGAASTLVPMGRHHLAVWVLDPSGVPFPCEESVAGIYVKVIVPCEETADCDDGILCSNQSCVAGTCNYGPVSGCCVSGLECDGGIGTCEDDACVP